MLDNIESIRSSRDHYARTIFTPELPDVPAIFQNDFLVLPLKILKLVIYLFLNYVLEKSMPTNK